jgi:hypothetical protein
MRKFLVLEALSLISAYFDMVGVFFQESLKDTKNNQLLVWTQKAAPHSSIVVSGLCV